MNPKKLIPWITYLLFFAVLNETVFNVSTPAIAKQFNLSPLGVSWMMTIFLVFFGIGSVIYGKLSDIYSLRRLIFVGITVYNVGSVMGFVCQSSYPLVVAARAIQGIGCSALPALVFVVVAKFFPPEERGKIFGFLTGTVSLSICIGPVIGGLVSGYLHWSYLFLIPLLILVAIPFLARELPDEPRREGKVDLLGATLVALTVGFLIVYLNFTHWYYLAVFLGLLAFLLIWINVAKEPFIKPSLFRNVPFTNGVIAGFCLFSMVMGLMFLTPLMLADIHKMNPNQIGLVLFPGAFAAIFFGPIGGRLADRWGNNLVVFIGLGFLIVSMILMALFLSLTFWVIAAAFILTYIGFAVFQTAMMNSISQILPENDTGIGMGVFNLVAIISGAIGTAIVGKILAGGLLDFSFLRVVENAKGQGYSNLLLAFIAIVIFGGGLFLYSYRGQGKNAPGVAAH
ncbi:MAG: MFS transporter [Spirochaetia bacterium]|nr:MFS transporter [Spirochaetia bacterium]